MASVLIFFVLLSIFYLGLFLGKSLSAKHNSIARIGANLYSKKNEQLKNSPFFKPIRKGLRQGSFLNIFWLIGVLILLKSVAFYWISILLITPVLLLLQGISMGSMFSYYKKTAEGLKQITSITFWQLISHCAAGTYGMIEGLNWLLKINVQFHEGLIVFGLLSLISGGIAAYYETKFLLDTKKPAS